MSKIHRKHFPAGVLHTGHKTFDQHCCNTCHYPDSMPAVIRGGASVGNCGHSGNRLGMGKPSQSHCGLGMGSMGLPTQIPGGPHPGSLSGLLVINTIHHSALSIPIQLVVLIFVLRWSATPNCKQIWEYFFCSLDLPLNLIHLPQENRLVSL